MRRLELPHRWHAVGGVALLLWLMLFDTPAVAAMPAMQEVGPVVTSAMGSESMPVVSDCVTCVLCCIAPAPTTLGFSGECKESDDPVWRLFTPSLLHSTRGLDAAGAQARLPVRIAFCRWLD